MQGGRQPIQQLTLPSNAFSCAALTDYHVLFVPEPDQVTFLNRGIMPIEKDKFWDGLLSPDIYEDVFRHQQICETNFS